MSDTVIIIGAGQAGAQAAASLRQQGWEGEIVLIGAEKDLPYQRPPLSKAYLKGEMERERLYLKPAEFYDSNDIELWLDEEVTGIDRGSNMVRLKSGKVKSYAKLILATGADVRCLSCPGADDTDILYLRDLADSDRLREILTPGTRVGVIGGGYIGLEAAASARSLGCPVSVIEAQKRIMARVTCEQVSDFFRDYHAAQGVHFHTDAGVERFETRGEETVIHLANGREVACDVVLAGIGVVARTDLAEDAGLAINNGIVVDHHARTDDPDIYAAGDCTNLPSGHYGERMRLESVHNAIEQAKTAALHICGKEKPYDQIPWFWSDQYDLKLQTAGLWAGHDETVLRGDPEQKSFAVFYLKEGHIIAVDAVNAGPEFMGTRKIMANRPAIPAGDLADMSVPFIEIARKYA